MHLAPRSTTLGTLGNLLWLVFAGGIPLCLTYLLASAVLAVTIVGFPFAVAAWRLGLYALLPFDRQVVARRDGLGSGLLGLVFNPLVARCCSGGPSRWRTSCAPWAAR